MQRHPGLGFMGGAHVFPGGKLDPNDRDPRWAPLLPAHGADVLARLRPLPGQPWNDNHARGFLVAAIRELYEEAGVILGCTSEGVPYAAAHPSWPEVQQARYGVAAGEVDFAQVLEAAGVALNLEALTYWAHWITPSVERRRFDTRFFVATMPIDQHTKHDDRESTASEWFSPAGALEAYAAGAIVLPPPTFRCLEELSEYTTIDGVIREARSRVPRPLLPKIRQVEGSLAILMPWDPLYEDTEGEGLPCPDADPQVPSRIVLTAGRWHSLRGAGR